MSVTIKITGSKEVVRLLNAKLEEISRGMAKGVAKVLERKVISEMRKGKSPVKDGRWDRPYSEAYLKAIKGSFLKGLGKRQSPVNLKVTGVLYESYKITKQPKSLIVEFTDSVAVFHNEKGAGKSGAIRRMLPTKNGEEFNKNIEKDIQKVITNIVKRIIRKKL